MREIKKYKIKDSEEGLPGWNKYEQLRSKMGDFQLIHEMAKGLSDQELEDLMDFIASQHDIEFRARDNKVVEELTDDIPDDKSLLEGFDETLIEELASHLNKYFDKEALEIVVEYEDGVPTIACYNYLTEEEQTSLDEVSTSWLQERLPEDRYTDIYVSKDNHCFHLTLERP